MRHLLLLLLMPTLGCGTVAWSAEPTEPATPPVEPADAGAVEPELDASLFDKKGKINRSAYQRYVLDWRTKAIDKRLGPDAADVASDKSTKVAHKDDSNGKDKEKEKAKEIWLPRTRVAKAARNGAGMPYTVGDEPASEGGDYSSTHGQVFYAPDQAGDPGVDRISILDSTFQVFCCRPEPTWWGGSHPEPAVLTPSWQQQTKGQLGAPVAMARAYGSWSNNGLMVFSSGLVGAAGTCTSASKFTSLMLPKDKIPTAISMTNQNEFALITVWDTKELKGQIAVIAIDSMVSEGGIGTFEFHRPYPGLFSNAGSCTSLKLLGFIDLPFATPTAICAVGNYIYDWISWGGKNTLPHQIDLGRQDVRDTFYKGNNATRAQSAGYAVVASRYEHKVSFIDLQPLFEFYREMYFTTPENYTRTRDLGPGPKQWPYTFEGEPRCKPVVVKTVKVQSPTAVNASIHGDEKSRAYIASEDGRLGIWRVAGLATPAPVTSAEIGQVGVVRIGRNPVCLVYNKYQGWDTPDYMRNEVIAVCRGDSELVWVRITGDTGEVVHRLRDKRLIDPVYAEVADTHGTSSHVISVADFKGRQVINYRFGPVVFHTGSRKRYGMGEDGMAEFECGGVMPFPGSPYLVCGTNVN